MAYVTCLNFLLFDSNVSNAVPQCAVLEEADDARRFWIKLRVCSKLQNRICLVNVRNSAGNVYVDKAHFFFLNQCASILREIIY